MRPTRSATGARVHVLSTDSLRELKRPLQLSRVLLACTRTRGAQTSHAS